MQITIHRGTREIGGSCVELRSGSSRVVLDIGKPLEEPGNPRFDFKNQSFQEGPELVECGLLPDIPGLYRWETHPLNVDGVLLSHSHIDHCGFVHYVHPRVPVYTGKATQRLMEINKIFTPFEGLGDNINTFTHGRAFRAGKICIIPLLVDHSAFDAYSFLIESEGKRVFYSGDFRNHGRKYWALSQNIKKLSGRQLDAAILEGTVFGRPPKKFKSEKRIEKDVVNLLNKSKVPALLCASAQNIDRMVSLYRAAIKCDRILVVDVYAASVLDAIKDFANIPHPSLQYERLKVFFPYLLSQSLVRKGYAERLYRYRHFKIERSEIIENLEKVIMLVRPSMIKDLEKLNIPPGAYFIYSMWEGYKNDTGMKKLIEFAQKKHMEIYDIHTSGHASLEALKELVDALKPGSVVPIHTFHPEKYDELDADVRLLQDGEMCEL